MHGLADRVAAVSRQLEWPTASFRDYSPCALLLATAKRLRRGILRAFIHGLDRSQQFNPYLTSTDYKQRSIVIVTAWTVAPRL